jgi:hypothetical protein
MSFTFDEAVAELTRSAKFQSWGKLRLHLLLRDDLAQVATDKHYTPVELAKAWGVSVQTIREIFGKEEGVLKIGSNGTRSRRRYKTLRIPESVVDRVHTRLSA